MRAVLDHAEHRPEEARILYDDGVRGPAAALDMRDASLARAGAIIDSAHDAVAAGTPVPRIPSATLVGGLYRLLAPRLRAGRGNHEALLVDLLGWANSYRSGKPNLAIRRKGSLSLPGVALAHAPPTLGAASQPARGESEAITRARILQALAARARRDGYVNLTIAAITEAAAIDSRTFHKHFATKEHAYAALQQHYGRQLIGVVASANTGEAPWPQRIWSATRDAAQYLEENATLAWSVLVGGYAAGDEAIREIEHGAIALTLHLEEGYRYPPAPVPAAERGGAGEGPPRLALEAIARAMQEVGYRAVREGGDDAFRLSVPEVAWIALAPFVGADRAEELVEAWALEG